MTSCDYLIVGGGIAGLTMARYLEDEQQNFLIINQDLAGAATKVSSGVINPVTGQRFVLSWKYEELKHEFLKFYHDLENTFNETFIEETQLIQMLGSAEDQNVWFSRTADPIYKTYFEEASIDLSNYFHLPELTTTGIIKSMYLVKIERLLQHLEHHYKQQNKYILGQFDFNELKRTENELIWRDVQVRKSIVFAEGFRISSNPFFNWLPVIPLKGECIQVEIPGMHFQSIYKSDYSIVPFKENTYWIGSNFYLFETGLEVTVLEKDKQLEFLKQVLKYPFKLEKHSFGIRPASRDRRPILGAHPDDVRLIVFNGLGAKGLSLAPFCAFHLVQWMLKDIPIPNDLSLNRFKSKGFEAKPM